MNREVSSRFCGIVGSDNVYFEEPMKKHTTFRIGGAADYYLCPHTPEEIREIIQVCREEQIPWFVIGNGSNLLVSDSGYRGAVIQIYRNFSRQALCSPRLRRRHRRVHLQVLSLPRGFPGHWAAR